MKNFTSNLIKTIGFIAVVFFVGFVFLQGLNKSEVVTCNELKSQASQFAGFTLAQWQKDMCDTHNIVIDAPVQK